MVGSYTLYFNSRPHEEVDTRDGENRCLGCISTHDLTKRSTQKRLVSAVFRFISTHDLTRRSTTSTGSMSDNSLFQLTTSRGGRRKILAVQSQLVLTTSQGGRRQDRGRDQGYQRISTHDLARRSTQFFL